MNEAEQKPRPNRITLVEGERILETHPESLVQWPPGKPPGGQPINHPRAKRPANPGQ